MPVMHRNSSAPTPAPMGPQSLEDLLRDAATFAETENAPEGLAFRALSRQIAAQNARERCLPGAAGRKSRVVLWLGGLSAGTLAGASAAALLIAHLNGNSFRIPPETLPAPIAAASADASQASGAMPVRRPERAIAGTEKSPVKLAAARTADFVPRRPIAGAGERARPKQITKWERNPPAGPQAVHRPHETRRPKNPDTTEPAAAQWKTETVDETVYQLVTTAYVADTESGSDSVSGDEKLMPVQMQICFEPTAPVTDPGASGLK